MEGTNIAKLVASLGFQIEDKQLNSFLKKVQKTVTELKTLRDVSASKIQFKIGLDQKEFTSVKGRISRLGSTKITLSKLAIGQAGLTEIRTQIQQAMGRKLNLAVNVKEANAQLHTWAKRTNDKFKLNIKAQVSKRALAQSLREATEYATGIVGVLKLKDPKVKVGIDKEYLRTEIKDAIAHIQREVRIKIDLTGSVSGAPRGAGGGGGQRGHVGTMGATGLGVAAGGMETARAIIPGLGVGWGVGQLSTISQDLAAIDTSMLLLTGTSEEAAKQMEFLKSLTHETGKTMRQLAPAYAQIFAATQGSALEGQAGQDLFASFTRYGMAMGLSDEAMKGSLRGMTQMIGKQQVYAEELKGQVGEHMPTIVKMSADVLYGKKDDKGVYSGGSVAKLLKDMEAGKIKADALLPKIGVQMALLAHNTGAYEKALNSSRVAQGRFNVLFEESVRNFADAGFDRTMFNFWHELTDAMLQVSKSGGGLARGFQILMTPIIAVIRLTAKLIEHWPKIAAGFGLTSERAGVLAGVILGLIFPWTRFLTLISMAAVALDDFTTYLDGGSSEFGKWFDNLSPENQKLLFDFVAGVKEFGVELASLANAGWEKLKELWSGFDGMSPERVANFKNMGGALGELAIAIVKLLATIAEGAVLLLQTLWNSGVPDQTIRSITLYSNAITALTNSLTALLRLDFKKLSNLLPTIGVAVEDVATSGMASAVVSGSTPSGMTLLAAGLTAATGGFKDAQARIADGGKGQYLRTSTLGVDLPGTTSLSAQQQLNSGSSQPPSLLAPAPQPAPVVINLAAGALVLPGVLDSQQFASQFTTELQKIMLPAYPVEH
jgi:tape measure domain-containing protein